MMPKAEEVKKEIERRFLERKGQKEEIDVIENGEMSELESEMVEEMEDGFEDEFEGEDLMSFEEALEEAASEGYEAYFMGAESDQNPYEALAEDEDIDVDVSSLYAASWSEGWVAAHKECCTTDVVLAARKFVNAINEQEANEMFAKIQESVRALEEVADLDGWEAVLDE